MRIINKSKNIILAENTTVADSFIHRLQGLLGREEFKGSQALILKPCNSIHTFFMRFPIDVLFIDRDNRIIKAISSLKPYRITGIYFNAALVIELPAGAIKTTSTHPNDKLSFE